MLKRYIIVQDEDLMIIENETYYKDFPKYKFIADVNTEEEAKKIMSEIAESGTQKYFEKILSKEEPQTIEEKYSHLIYYFSQDKNEANETADRIKQQFDIEVYGIKKTNRGNYKAKIAVHKEDVCDIACKLSSEKQSIFVYDWSYLKQLAEEGIEKKKRFYRDFRYLCDKLLDDKKIDVEEIKQGIEEGNIFENELVNESYSKLIGIIPENDMKTLALSILEKSVDFVEGKR